MDLYLYYSIHSTINQVKKVLKTWIFLIVLAAVLGTGTSALSLSQSLSNVSTYTPANEIVSSLAEYFQFNIISKSAFIELVASLMMLSILTLQIITAERVASQLFLPADVNFLFTSDRTPQQNLTFRVLSTIGTVIVATVYLCFQLPGLVGKFQATPFAGFIFLMFWLFSMTISIFIRILIYELTCRHQYLRNNLRYFLFASLGIIIVSFYFYYLSHNHEALLINLDKYFNAPWTHYIPIYGWLKGMLSYALNDNVAVSFVYMFLSILSIVGLWLAIKLIPSDYYEDATIKSEEIALYIAETGQVGVLSPSYRRHKKFKGSFNREGFKFGEGANVFFFKKLYNRLRFHKLIFTKASMTYLIFMAISGLFASKIMDEPSVYGSVALLAGFVFLHTIINFSVDDKKHVSFIISPENTWIKLFWLTLGNTVECILDTTIPLAVGSYLAVGNIFEGLKFLPFILSIDLFASAVDSFIDVVIPESIDKTFKQVLQIIFLYCAVIPDVLVIITGLLYRRAFIGFFIATVIDIIFGILFVCLTGVKLDPVSGNLKKIIPVNSKEASNTMSKIGFALLLMFLVISLLQYTLPVLIADLLPENTIMYTLMYYVPIYFIGFPLAFIALKNVQAEEPLKTKLPLKQFFAAFAMCFFLMYSGNIFGLAISRVAEKILPTFLTNPYIIYEFDPIIQIIGITILSPILEELLFRKFIIDRIKKYGEISAIIISSLLFSLFHANFNQIFYAFLLGTVFGTIYVKTGDLKYSAIMHVIINFMGLVIAPYFLTTLMSSIPWDQLTGNLIAIMENKLVIAFLSYITLLIVISLIGFVIFTYFMKSVRLKHTKVTYRSLLLNGGTISFLALMIFLILFRN